MYIALRLAIVVHLLTPSQGGVFGSLMGTPIINLPQTGNTEIPRRSSPIDGPTAVLGLHAIKEKPVAIDGKVEIRPVRLVLCEPCSSIANAAFPDDVPRPYVRP